MTIELQKPDDMSDEDWEDYLEERAAREDPDIWDSLEQLRQLLNSSPVEAMYYLHKHSRFGKQCEYYKKARRLLARDYEAQILSLLDEIQKNLSLPEGQRTVDQLLSEAQKDLEKINE